MSKGTDRTAERGGLRKRLARLSRLDRSVLLQTLLRKASLTRWFFFNRMEMVRLEGMRDVRIPLDHLQAREAVPDDIADLERIHPRGELYRAKFDAGDICIIVHSRDQPAAQAWFAPVRVQRSVENGFEFDMGDAGCWSYWVDVLPAYRLRGALLKLWRDGLPLLQQRGIREVYSAIEISNQRSLTSHVRLGFESLFTYSFVRCAGILSHQVIRPDGTRRRGWGTFRGSARDSRA